MVFVGAFRTVLLAATGRLYVGVALLCVHSKFNDVNLAYRTTLLTKRAISTSCAMQFASFVVTIILLIALNT